MVNGGSYYNEIDPFPAAWLRELIKAGVIAPGEVDERSIAEIEPEDLREFWQCHFFAGIGVWSYALRAAGWPDDTPVWTGSCPCQGFSASGKRGGFSDQRHLWPAWFRLIRELRPDTIFGEQVASKDGLAWLDVVSADLEGAGYAIGPADLCAAGFGAPHIRQRLYFVANLQSGRLNEQHAAEYRAGQYLGRIHHADSGAHGRMADAEECRSGASGKTGGNGAHGANGISRGGIFSGMADSEATKRRGTSESRNGGRGSSEAGGSGFTNGFWSDAEWLWCRDQKYRPVEPSTFPLVTGTPNRVGRLRGYGNALCAAVATAFIEAFIEVKKDDRANGQLEMPTANRPLPTADPPAEPGCIDDLIGTKMRAAGMRCTCAKCSQQSAESSGQSGETKRRPVDRKSAAAGNDSE